MDWQRIPTINAGRISLRPIVENDIDSLYAIYSDPEVMRYWGSLPMKDPREAKDFLAEIVEDLRRRQCIQWGIARRTDNRIIGTIALFYLDFVARKAEIGFALGRAHWGMGYMQEALRAAIGYAVNEMDLRRIGRGCRSAQSSFYSATGNAGFSERGISSRKVARGWRDTRLAALRITRKGLEEPRCGLRNNSRTGFTEVRT
jgi:ribosomal-protein-alanine N-acetyltransferase